MPLTSKMAAVSGQATWKNAGKSPDRNDTAAFVVQNTILSIVVNYRCLIKRQLVHLANLTRLAPPSEIQKRDA
jgi:hypothetical protein